MARGRLPAAEPRQHSMVIRSVGPGGCASVHGVGKLFNTVNGSMVLPSLCETFSGSQVISGLRKSSANFCISVASLFFLLEISSI